MRAPEFWQQDGWLTRLLTPLGRLYGASVEWKRGHAAPYRSSAAVICVGNLSVGGTGKTPIAIEIARRLQSKGRKPVFLTRGYGGRLHGPIRVGDANSAADVGDEPLLLREAAPVVVARDRTQGAHLAETLGDAIVMDDGHQNFVLEKDLSLVVVDGETGFGNRRVLPAGPLRESVAQGLARADAVVIVGDGEVDLEGFARPVLRAHLDPQGMAVGPKRVVAFAGIGRPEKFFHALERQGATVLASAPYADHHAYTQSELARLKAKARALDATLVTTEKDYVRLTQAQRDGILALPVRAAFDRPKALDALLDSLPAKR
ncbi:MAG TPA: tetraacyldisaccharide 4'-kinase [Rhizomicrobium sp.]|nr:tetraacyldisaccharide 4'-kinase [Rhizomicrobium sp.]